MKYKQKLLADQMGALKSINPILYNIVQEMDDYTNYTYGITLTVTSVHRPKKGWDSGIHSLWRAVDIRTNDLPKEAVRDLKELVNKSYIYDPDRPKLKTLIVHNVIGKHIHVQTHPNTVKVEHAITPKEILPKTLPKQTCSHRGCKQLYTKIKRVFTGA